MTVPTRELGAGSTWAFDFGLPGDVDISPKLAVKTTEHGWLIPGTRRQSRRQAKAKARKAG